MHTLTHAGILGLTLGTGLLGWLAVTQASDQPQTIIIGYATSAHAGIIPGT